MSNTPYKDAFDAEIQCMKEEICRDFGGSMHELLWGCTIPSCQDSHAMNSIVGIQAIIEQDEQ